MLWGREADQALVAGLLARARAGHSAVLVLRGDPGIGKTALLRQAAAAATGMTVLRCTGVQTEAEVPFAALHQLLRPVLPEADPPPALRAALGLGPSTGGDQLLIGVALLTVLANLAERRPVACLVDDAHWLDHASAQALRFAARRLEAESVALLVATRDVFASDLPTHVLPPLGADAAEHLVAALPATVRARVLAEAAGNPLALLELPHSAAAAAGVSPPDDDRRPLPLPDRIQQAFAARLDALPPDALLLAAADDEADLATLLRAGAHVDALAQAERARLIEVADGRVVFTHPLLRAAAYRHPTFDRRLAAHRALAAAVGDPDRRAWHLAAAAAGADEEAATALEQAAERARGRNGFAATAAALQRAADLSVDPARRAARLEAAAEAADTAGQPDRARALLDRLPPGAAVALRAKLAFDEGDAAAAHDLLLAGGTGPMLFTAARNAWQLGDRARLAEVSRLLHARGAPAAAGLDAALAIVEGTTPPRAGLDAMAELVAAGLDAARATPEGSTTRQADPDAVAELRAAGQELDAAFVAGLLGDFATTRTIATAVVARARADGAPGRLPRALATLAAAELHLGLFRDAAVAAFEARPLGGPVEGMLAWLAAVRGEDSAEAAGTVPAPGFAGLGRGRAAEPAWTEWALALADLGRGRAAEASDRLEECRSVFATPDRVEAAVRAGRRERAEAACARLEAWAATGTSPWADAALTRCRALLTDSLDVPGGFPWEAARTRLAIGERLRRERRKTEARTHLRAAAELFDRLGAAPWSARARFELRAAGERVSGPAPADDALAALSPQELQIVRLVAAGRTNREIATMLFISPKTVAYHLYRAFPKLGVTSRTQLARLDLT
ncbi:LuxR family transcriptional regulator [Dactylosporangium sp. NPDC000244]|uniref:helix-turn-helix transcriptional regulator n=1 Tax=Dactylosporangium sp. NPDC000244 TaxID=3154365 RepID=UPI00332B302C